MNSINCTQKNNNILTKIKPHDNDVLCGVYKDSYNHPGNKYYRHLIQNDKKKYATTSCTKSKKEIAQQVIHRVRTLNPPGRFLNYNKNEKIWYDIGAKKTLQKVQQALREGQQEVKRKIKEFNITYDKCHACEMPSKFVKDKGNLNSFFSPEFKKKAYGLTSLNDDIISSVFF